MDKPCIVCEENCPVSPKAIYTQESFTTIRDGVLTVRKWPRHGRAAADNFIEVEVEQTLIPGKFATGDYYCALARPSTGGLAPDNRVRIAANTERSIELSSDQNIENIPAPGARIEIQVRLQKPYVDIEKCIGCGICEHECPVSGKKAIRISAVGETRYADRKLLLEPG
jgi:NAD-dependent dihydropyrimidine dehydrogenase PreA subunit